MKLKKLLQSDSLSFKVTLLTSLLVLGSAALVSWMLHRAQEEEYRSTYFAALTSVAERNSGELDRNIDSLRNSVLFLAEMSHIQMSLDRERKGLPTDEWQRHLESLFVNYLKEHRIFSRERLVDAGSGRELVRADYLTDMPFITPAMGLQSHAGEAFFEAGRNLGVG